MVIDNSVYTFSEVPEADPFSNPPFFFSQFRMDKSASGDPPPFFTSEPRCFSAPDFNLPFFSSGIKDRKTTSSK